jgi:hypothetical protein
LPLSNICKKLLFGTVNYQSNYLCFPLICQALSTTKSEFVYIFARTKVS